MELVKNLRGQCCFSPRAQLESAQSGTGKAQDRGRLPPPRTSLATFIILVVSQELKDGSALPAVITQLQFAVKTYRSIQKNSFQIYSLSYLADSLIVQSFLRVTCVFLCVLHSWVETEVENGTVTRSCEGFWLVESDPL